MSFVIRTDKATEVPKAAAGSEMAKSPLEYVIDNDEYTIPMATNNLDAVTVFIEPEPPLNTGGSAAVEFRSGQDGAWADLTTIDVSGGDPASERLSCPMGQIRVKGVAEEIRVKVQGLGLNKN